MKKLINAPRDLVRETLESIVDTTPGLGLLEDEDVVVRLDPAASGQKPVAVLSGGGSGHEPGHAGYVGRGMLSAAIAGDVFTSPSVDTILAGIRTVGGPAGALLIVKNYTGDRLNFGLAAEIATGEGIPTRMVLVGDDVALRDTVAPDRRRGIAGTILVHKVAGAAAAAGASLDEVVDLAQRVADTVGSMGVALGACTVPAVGRPGFELGENEIELGLGIHGEQGVERVAIQPADRLVERLMDTIVLDRGIEAGRRVAILVNGLGATPPIELAIVARRALSYARQKGLIVERLYSGVYLSALDMPGVSLSLLPLDDKLLDLLDAPTSARGWASDGRVADARQIVASSRTEKALPPAEPGPQSAALRNAVAAVAKTLIAAEAELADLDGRAGDGDLGASMVRGAEAIAALPEAAFNTPADLLAAMSDALRRTIAGSSGPFYAVGLARAARLLEGTEAPNASQWHAALGGAIEAISALGGAKPGDRTMLDALAPAADAMAAAIDAGKDIPGILEAVADAARSGAESTADMTPRTGRASYLGQRAIGIPDGGAAAVAIWLTAIADIMKAAD
jgi:ATP-dependent dihydroxyacetone kinase